MNIIATEDIELGNQHPMSTTFRYGLRYLHQQLSMKILLTRLKTLNGESFTETVYAQVMIQL